MRIYIIPRQLQDLAIEENIASPLEINWELAKLEEVGRYMGTLAAADVVAKTIALRNRRKGPTKYDYLASFASICLWPPNKPPVFTSIERQRLYPAFYSDTLRNSIPAAVGQAAIRLPRLLAQKSALEAVTEVFPTKREDYFNAVFNPDALQ